MLVYPQNQIGNNTTSSTPFVTADDVVYFRGTDDDKLWRVNSSGTGQFQIGTNTTKSAPFVFDDPAGGEWVYFQGTGHARGDYLWKVRANSAGADLTHIGANKTASTPFVFVDPNDGNVWVCFQGTDKRLLKVMSNPSGTGGMHIGRNYTNSTPFVFVDPKDGIARVFFQGTDNRLLRVNADGTEGMQLGTEKIDSAPVVAFDEATQLAWVYYRREETDGLKRIRADGLDPNTEFLGATTQSTPCVTADGWVFFRGGIEAGEEDRLCRVRVDGTQPSRLGGNTTASTPAVGRRQQIGYKVGRWVYFQGTDDKLWRLFQPDDPHQSDEPKQPAKKQDARILEILYTNPEHLTDFGVQDAQTVAFGHAEPTGPILGQDIGGPFPSVDAKEEWKQVLPPDLTDTAAHEADFEGPNLVGATGWVLHPEGSGGDVPFDHPFGFDWEFMLALDQPDAEKKRYTFLLTPGDQTCDEEGYCEAVKTAQAIAVPIPSGIDNLPSLLGVEIDGGLVPQQFVEGVVEGDRMAVFGRWIVDCGHQKPITRCSTLENCDQSDPAHNVDIHPGTKAFRTEIHPPLLMAVARATTGSITGATSGTEAITRVLFTSRPFLVSHRYTTDTDTIFDDSGPDDGPFVSHFVNELIKVNETILGIPLASTMIEAHPKIMSKPFAGTYSAHFVVRPPLLHLRHGTVVQPDRLMVSFQFTVRNGCRVQVTSSGLDSVDVVISLNSDNYNTPQRPDRRERTWTPDDLAALQPDIGSKIGDAAYGSALVQVLGPGTIIGSLVVDGIIQRGIKTDEYDVDEIRNVNILDTSHAVTAFADEIPADQGVVANDSQPYPVFGWLEVSGVYHVLDRDIVFTTG